MEGLATSRIRLEPLEASHHAALCEIGLAPALWALTTIRVRTSDEMSRYIAEALDARAAGTALPFAIVLQSSGAVVGTTRIHTIVPRHRRCEIGFTWIGAPWQRQGLSSESKYLLLTHAFERAGWDRVEFKADIRNEPSCRALERLGAVKEGVLRNYMFSAHAGSRDIALYSIVRSDWPDVKARLAERFDV